MRAVSVILPTHDRPALLPRAARSVLDQDFGDLELIVVDDGSRSRAEQTLLPFGDPRVRVLATPVPLGPARARNLGLEAAGGEWIAFQDDDDEWLPGKLSRQLDAARRAADDPGVVYCPFWISRAGDRRVIGGRSVRRARGSLYEELWRGNFIALPAAVVRRACIEQVGGFDADLPCFEDWELFLRLASRFTFEHVDEPLLLTHESPVSVNKAPSAVQAEAFETILRKHHDEIGRRPEVHAEILFRVAHHRCLSGQLPRGQALHRQSFRMRPSLTGAVALVASYLGTRPYGTLSRAHSWIGRGRRSV